jgi:rare lipoprotein A
MPAGAIRRYFTLKCMEGLHMKSMIRMKYVATVALAWGLGAAASMMSVTVGAAPSQDPQTPQSTVQPTKPELDRTGRTRVGKASFYASRYAGRKMADGTPMRLDSNNAASLTLPLGTTATVTNLRSGQSAEVVIRDRGPYVKGRIIDLSPSTARQIGIERKQGVAKVQVVPIVVPLADGTVNSRAIKPGVARLASKPAADRGT